MGDLERETVEYTFFFFLRAVAAPWDHSCGKKLQLPRAARKSNKREHHPTTNNDPHDRGPVRMNAEGNTGLSIILRLFVYDIDPS